MNYGVRARYTLEFKQEAVRLVRGGEKLSAVARTLAWNPTAVDRLTFVSFVSPSATLEWRNHLIIGDRHHHTPPY